MLRMTPILFFLGSSVVRSYPQVYGDFLVSHCIVTGTLEDNSVADTPSYTVQR